MRETSTVPGCRGEGHRRSRPSASRVVRCAIYTRSSVGPESGLRHFTADAQREVVGAFIARHSQEGWVALAERYDDAGLTGCTMGRPALNRLLADALWGALDCVVVYRVDRVSRSFLDFGRILGTLTESGVGFVSATEPFDTRDTTGHLMLNMLEAFAQFERETLAERIRDKVNAMRRKGKHVGGTPPLGYRLDRETRRIVPDEGEAGLVREIFELYLGRPSMIHVAEELNRRGWRTRSWTGRDGRRYGGVPFSPGRVWVVLSDITYTGQVRHRGRVVPGEQEAILPEETFNSVAELLARHRQGRRGYLSLDPDGALLGGILWCRSCQAFMGHFHGGGRRRGCLYYACAKDRVRRRALCPPAPIRADAVEQDVLNGLWGLVADRERRCAVLQGVLCSGTEEAAALGEGVQNALSALQRRWDQTDPAERQSMLRALLARVEYDGGTEALSLRLSRRGITSLACQRESERDAR